jgi:hypothetical protein
MAESYSSLNSKMSLTNYYLLRLLALTLLPPLTKSFPTEKASKWKENQSDYHRKERKKYIKHSADLIKYSEL